ncbi:MAG: PepSY-associated TM helix domain-containing protein [Sphingobium sp.]
MTRPGFTQSMAWLHSWFGLIVGWLLFMIFVTGTLAVYGPEITQWMRPETGLAAASPEQALANAERHLRLHAPQAHEWEVELPSERDPALTVSWHGEDDREIERWLDPATGRSLPFHATEGGQFFNLMHYELRAGFVGGLLVMLVGVILCGLLVSGIIIHKRIFRDFFTFRPGKGQRSWLDAHNAAGVLTLPFLLMIAYTGVIISFPAYLPSVAFTRFGGDLYAPRRAAVTDLPGHETGKSAQLAPLLPMYKRAVRTLGPISSLMVRNPDDGGAQVRFYRAMTDRVASVADHASCDGVTGRQIAVQQDWHPGAYAYRGFVGIHMARFGGGIVRLLYFLSGLVGCALIATGLILFIEKRRLRSPDAGARFLGVAERLNVVAIAGVLVACMAYLWASRVGPGSMADRTPWEIGLFFVSWVLCLVHALLRPPRAAWREQFGLAALLCLGLPLLNGMTARDQIVAEAMRGDMARAGVEGTALAAGLILAWTVWRISRGKAA